MGHAIPLLADVLLSTVLQVETARGNLSGAPNLLTRLGKLRLSVRCLSILRWREAGTVALQAAILLVIADSVSSVSCKLIIEHHIHIL